MRLPSHTKSIVRGAAPWRHRLIRPSFHRSRRNASRGFPLAPMPGGIGLRDAGGTWRSPFSEADRQKDLVRLWRVKAGIYRIWKERKFPPPPLFQPSIIPIFHGTFDFPPPPFDSRTRPALRLRPCISGSVPTHFQNESAYACRSERPRVSPSQKRWRIHPKGVRKCH